MPYRENTPPPWGAILPIGLVVLLLGWVVGDRIVEWRQDTQMREQTLPACVARLGDEQICREHLEQHHAECARLTRGRGRSARAPRPDPAGYLECVVLGVDAWVADYGRKLDEAAKQRREDSPLSR